MEDFSPISIILSIIIVLAVLFIIMRILSKEPHRPNYKAFFIMGITWIPLGIVLENHGFWGIGLVFMIIGIVNRSKWKDEPKWSELTPEAKRTKLMMIIGLGVVFVLGLVVYFLVKSGVVG
jgi:hypothetical protein